MTKGPMNDEEVDKYQGLYKKLREVSFEPYVELRERFMEVLYEELHGDDLDVSVFACVSLALHANVSCLWASLTTGVLRYFREHQPNDLDDAVVVFMQMTKETTEAHKKRILKIMEEEFDDFLKEEKS